MSPSSMNTIFHIFGGGYAPDRGKSASILPGDGGTVIVPYLLNAENCIFEESGAPRKIGGLDKVNSAELESGALVMGIADYWRQGTSFTPTQRRVIHVGTTIKQDDADGNFNDIFTGLEAGVVPDYTQFNDDLIIASDSTMDVPRVTDGSTHANLAGTPPNFSFSVVHRNRVWASGVATDPSGLYYSAAEDHEDWVGVGSGLLQIDPNDGDRITGLAVYRKALIIFKGPNKGSIHRLTGTDPNTFSLEPFVSRGLGSVNHRTIFYFRDDVGFMWSDGTIHSLNATERFGDFEQASLSRDFATTLRARLSTGSLRFAVAETFDNLGHVRIAVPQDASSENNYMLNMDYRFDPPRWSHSETLGPFIQSIVDAVDPSDANKRVLLCGGNDGFVRRMDRRDLSIDGTAAIPMAVDTPALDYQLQMKKKVIYFLSVGVAPKGADSGSARWRRDDKTEQSKTFVQQSGGAVLAPAPTGFTAFTLGDSTDGVLGSSSFRDIHLTLHEGGEFEHIAYGWSSIEQGQDLQIEHFSATLKPSADTAET